VVPQQTPHLSRGINTPFDHRDHRRVCVTGRNDYSVICGSSFKPWIGRQLRISPTKLGSGCHFAVDDGDCPQGLWRKKHSGSPNLSTAIQRRCGLSASCYLFKTHEGNRNRDDTSPSTPKPV
jgi:hypothetical protein